MSSRLALIAAVLVVTLVTGIQGGNRAAAAEQAVEAVFGNVIAVAVPDSVTVATDDGVVRLLFDDATSISGQGIESISDVGEGDRLIATAFPQPDGTLIADRILIQPILSKPVTRHIFGVVLESEVGQVVVQDRDGTVVTLDVISGIEIPEAGEAVTVVASLDRRTGRLEARAFQRVADTIRRIEDAADSTLDDEERERLKAAIEEARTRHLSILEQARIALEQARSAVASGEGDAARAEARLLEVQAQYERIRARYEEWAAANDRPGPSARLSGVISYDPAVWTGSEGTFILTQRRAATDASTGVEFRFTPDTLVVFTVAAGADDSAEQGAGEAGPYRYTEPAPISDVKELVDSGASVIIVYNPDERPLTATQVIVLPPELDREISAAIEARTLRTYQGVVTLLELGVDIDGANGVVIVASDVRGEKMAVIVTTSTEITVDGEPAIISDLSVGHFVTIVFETPEVSAGDPAAVNRGSLRAATIDARSGAIDSDQVGIVGVIREIDADDRSVTIATRNGVVKATVPVDARISLDGLEARFDDLGVDDLVLEGSRYSRRFQEVPTLIAASPRDQNVRGTIVGLSLEPARVVVSTGDGDVLTMAVDEQTKLGTESGDELGIADLVIGQLIVSGRYTIAQRDSTSYLLATSLLIAEPKVVVATGFVRGVDPLGETIRIAVTRSSSGSDSSLSLEVTGQSVIVKNGAQIRGMDEIQVGDIVNSVAFNPSSNTIVKLAVSSPNLVQVRGTLEEVLGPREWLIVSADGRRIRLEITESTTLTLNGRPLTSATDGMAGDVVNEAVYIASSNDRTSGAAVSISMTRHQASTSPSNPPANRPVVVTSVTGIIDGYEEDEWISISGRRLRITDDTVFKGAEPSLGLVARASLRLGSDGVFTVTSLTVAARPTSGPAGTPGSEGRIIQDDDATSRALVRITGEITQLNQSVVVVDGTRVTLNRETRIDGMLTVGSTVTITARKTSTGAVVALEIVVEKRSGADDDSRSDSQLSAT